MVAPMKERRIFSIGTKVTEAEYSRLLAAVGMPQRVSEWVRETLLRAVDTEPAIATLFAEILALRTIIVNTHFSLAAGEQVSFEYLHQLVERADSNKFSRAQEQLIAARADRQTVGR